jgi:hypothetical protein
VPIRELQRGMYELRDPSKARRMTLAGIAGVWVVLAWWLVLGPGLRIAGIWFGWIGKPGDEVRRIGLAVGFSIYYIRILLTKFVFLKRGVSWSEVFAIPLAPLYQSRCWRSPAERTPRLWAGLRLSAAYSCSRIVDELLRGVRAKCLEAAT